MSKTQSWVMMGISAIALAIGVLLATGALTSAQSNTPTTAPSATTAPGRTFKSNEDPTHETGESTDREAQEDSYLPSGWRRARVERGPDSREF